MDKKRTQRILGILVIIALVIILFPLFFGKNDLPVTQAQSIKPPVFPEQPSNQTAMAEDSLLPVDGAPAATVGNLAEETTSPVTPPTVDPSQPSAPINPAVAMETTTNTPVIEPVKTEMTNSPESDSPVITIADNSIANNQAEVSIEKPVKHTKPTATKIAKHEPKSTVTTPKFATKAWVVQLGSFKEKSNARHLTDTLRAAGYKAFTQDFHAANGSLRTRVYIGPEYKQATATSLSAKVQRDLLLKGIVVSYKPFAL